MAECVDVSARRCSAARWAGSADVAVLARAAESLWEGEGPWRRPRLEAAPLAVGRLLRCGPSVGLSAEELRRPRVVVELSSCGAAARRVAVPQGVQGAPEDLDAAEESLWRFVAEALAEVAEAAKEGCPVLLRARPGEAEALELAVDVVALFALRALGASEDVALAAARAPPGGALAGLLASGRAPEVDLSALRGPESLEGEAAWLKEDLQTLQRLARGALGRGEAERGAFWCEEMVSASPHLIHRCPAAEAAVGLFLRGWALARLGRVLEAREALELGAALGGGRAREQLQRELAGLAPAAGALLLNAEETSEAVDASRRVLLVDTAAGPEGREGWRLLPVPARFSWAIFDPPALLAVSASPRNAAEEEALRCLRLSASVAAGAAQGKHPTVHSVVQEVAEVLRSGKGCLLHDATGGVLSGTALACFLCKYGLGIPEDCDVQEPSYCVQDAIELARGFRGRDAVDEKQVVFFEQSLWGELVMSRIGKRVIKGARGSPSDARPPPSMRIVPQPGDGNCLYHALAYGLGGRSNASSLRKRICAHMVAHPELEISGTPLSEWVGMASQCSIEDYVGRMQRSGEWGGAPEIAVCARMEGVDVDVYQPSAAGFELVAPFSGGEGTAERQGPLPKLRVLYVGRMHYDALVA